STSSFTSGLTTLSLHDALPILFLDIDIENHPIRSRARIGRYLHGFEEAEVLQAPLGPVDESAIVGIAFRQVEFAPDYVIPGAGIDRKSTRLNSSHQIISYAVFC